MNKNYINDFMKKVSLNNNDSTNDTRYQYSYVDLEEVIKNPTEYIIPECLPACKSLWSKNIETFMVSNNDDDNLYVLLTNVSEENMKIFKELHEKDSRFIISDYRDTVGIAVKGNDEKAMHELTALTEIFQVQDTLRFKTTADFLDEYKYTDGKTFINEYGYICKMKNPNLENATLQEALEKTGKSNLYIMEEDRVYESSMYLQWHKRYLQLLQKNLALNSLIENDNTISTGKSI